MPRRPGIALVYLLGDNSELSEPLQKILADTPYRVAQVVQDLKELDEQVPRASVELQSIVILIDREGQDNAALERLRAAKERIPNAKLIVVSPNGHARHFLECVRAGADAFLHDRDQKKQLISTLELVMDGMLVFPDGARELLKYGMVSDDPDVTE